MQSLEETYFIANNSFKIARWYNNFRAPSVLMIDDLSDAFVEVYPESFKNDWGYLCDLNGSAFDFLRNNLLVLFPGIKITFFTPYLKHGLLNEYGKFPIKKYGVGERIEFSNFLIALQEIGHEIAHHGSDHGVYRDVYNSHTKNNWIQEWELYKDVRLGVDRTLEGIIRFKRELQY